MRHLYYLGIGAVALISAVVLYKRRHAPVQQPAAPPWWPTRWPYPPSVTPPPDWPAGRKWPPLSKVDYDAAYPGAYTSPPTYWPATDPICLAAMAAMPRSARPNPTGGSPLPSLYDIATTASKSSDTKALRNVADLLDSAVAADDSTDLVAAAQRASMTKVATCFRERADKLDMDAGLAKASVSGGAAITSGMRVGVAKRVHPMLARRR